MAAHDENDTSNPLRKSSNGLDFEQLQNEFDSLLSDNKLLKPEDILPDEQNSLPDLFFQDTNEFLTTPNLQPFDSPADKSANAIDLADKVSADMVDNNASTDQEVDHALSHLDGGPELAAAESMADSTDSTNLQTDNKIFLKGSDLSDPDLPHANPDENESDLDDMDPFSDDVVDIALQDKAPVHPDMTEDHVMQPRSGGGRFVMLASIIVLTIAGGIYWLVGESEKETEQLASSQQPVSSAVTTLQKQASQQSSDKAVTAPVAETDKAAIQRVAVEKAKAKQLAAKQAMAKRAAAKRTAAEKAKAQRLLVEKASVKEMALIQPSTPLQKSPVKSRPVATTVVDEPGDWVIDLASVNSDKSARQHVARIRAMGVESKAVQVNDKGRIFHHILITGFTSKLEAMKRRDTLARKLGVRGAKVEKL